MDFEAIRLSYVDQLFDTCEKNFAETYGGPYKQYEEYKGLRFSVDSRVSAEDVDLECLPMWHITLENGVKIDAYPEEICKKSSQLL